MKFFFKKLHLYCFQFWLALIFTCFYPFICFLSIKPVNFHGMNFFRWMFTIFSTMLSGLFYRFNYEQKVDWKGQNFIICANHTSSLDITAIILLVKKNMVFMGKEELLRNYVTGIYFRTIDIPLNRKSKISAFRAFKKAEEEIKAGKHVVIFPEGMISDHYPPVLQPFKNGPFRLAIEQGIPILPVTICNNWRLMWDDGSKYGSKPGICDIYIHAPVEVSGMQVADTEVLRDQVYDLISKRLTIYESDRLTGLK